MSDSNLRHLRYSLNLQTGLSVYSEKKSVVYWLLEAVTYIHLYPYSELHSGVMLANRT